MKIWLLKTYGKARLDAMAETGLEFPEVCPYEMDDVLNRQLSFNQP